MLVVRGWDCRVLCGPMRDGDQSSLADMLAAQGLTVERRDLPIADAPFSLLHCRPGGVPTAVFAPKESSTHTADRNLHATFLALLDRLLVTWRPDLLLTYGGDEIARWIIDRAADRDTPVVFALHNFSYHDAALFRGVNAVLVPSQFCRRHYRQVLNLECVAIPSPINRDRCLCTESTDRKFVTFVNPQPHKGVFVFARIAAELGRRRPDIPLLVVESRGRASWLDRTGLDLRKHPNLHVMANTSDPREIYRVSKTVLMPSLWNESFGRVAAEAMLNGIPTLASNRGALPEVVADGGFLLDVPKRYTPETRVAPAASEVEPWLRTIERLCDEPSFYAEASRRAAAASQRWRPEIIAAEHDAFFRGLLGRGHELK